MTKFITSTEYLPPLPEELPGLVFTRLAQSGEIVIDVRTRKRVNEAAYQLVDGIHRHRAMCKAPAVLKHLGKCVSLLKRRSLTAEQRLFRLLKLLQEKSAGEVLSSLLLPACGGEAYFLGYSPQQCEAQNAILLARATTLFDVWKKAYAGRPGAEPDAYMDVLIDRLAKAYEEAGGRPTAWYSDTRGKIDDRGRTSQHRVTPFTSFVIAVAEEALRCFAPEIFEPGEQTDLQRLRAKFEPGALEERVLMVLDKAARARRRKRALDSARRRKKKSAYFTPSTPTST